VIELIHAFGLHISPKFYTKEDKSKSWFRHLLVVAIENRSTIQFQKQSAQYDKDLFYTLRPGSSRFSSFGFKTNYDLNTIVVRDPEQDIYFPRVTFLGDSFTMGWGVGDKESFPSVFQEISGLKTLNMEFHLMALLENIKF
jgi:hypothetical protein